MSRGRPGRVNRIHADKIIAALGKIRVSELTPQQVETRLLAPMAGKGHAKTTVIRTVGSPIGRSDQGTSRSAPA